MTNCLGTVEDVQLTGADCDLFEAEVVDGLIHLTMVEGGEYATRATYKVTPVLTVCGQDITGPTLSIKVTQSALKLAKLPNRTVYQSQTCLLYTSQGHGVGSLGDALSRPQGQQVVLVVHGEPVIIHADAENLTSVAFHQVYGRAPVSYTHLDVYKRQVWVCSGMSHRFSSVIAGRISA